jgi:hypothetical protein
MGKDSRGKSIWEKPRCSYGNGEDRCDYFPAFGTLESKHFVERIGNGANSTQRSELAAFANGPTGAQLMSVRPPMFWSGAESRGCHGGSSDPRDNDHVFNQSGGASELQIGQAVKLRNENPLVNGKGNSIRIEANLIVHSQDPGVNNRYTTPNYQDSVLAEKFIESNKK